jgi:hypothetical protein
VSEECPLVLAIIFMNAKFTKWHLFLSVAMSTKKCWQTLSSCCVVSTGKIGHSRTGHYLKQPGARIDDIKTQLDPAIHIEDNPFKLGIFRRLPINGTAGLQSSGPRPKNYWRTKTPVLYYIHVSMYGKPISDLLYFVTSCTLVCCPTAITIV